MAVKGQLQRLALRAAGLHSGSIRSSISSIAFKRVAIQPFLAVQTVNNDKVGAQTIDPVGVSGLDNTPEAGRGSKPGLCHPPSGGKSL